MSIDNETMRVLKTVTKEQWNAIFNLANEQLKEKEKPVSILQTKIQDMLKELGVSPNYYGYKYLQDAILMVCRNKNNKWMITVDIYPTVAKKYDTTTGRTERCIRYAIEIACSKGQPELLEKIFGSSYLSESFKPTNAYVIACFAEYVMKT